MHCFRCRSAGGLTLIEVVVGLALMASVLVGSLLAFSAHRHQQRTAEAKMIAVGIADELMNQFVASREGVPAAGRGTVPGRPGWVWRTSVVGTSAPAQVLMQVIRLEVMQVAENGYLRSLAAVDVVEPIEA